MVTTSIQPIVLQNVHILVVDNHQDTRDLYGFLLEDYGVQVTALSSVQEALAFLDLCLPSLLISELRFRKESASPLIARAKAKISNRGIGMPVIITSTCSATSVVDQLSIPIDAYLIKPIDVDHLVSAVWTLINQVRACQPVQLQLQSQPQTLRSPLLHCMEA